MTDRSPAAPPDASPLEALLLPTGDVTMRLGPGTRRQLEAVVAQAAGGLLVTAIEAAGYQVDDRWQLTIEQATLTRKPTAPPEGKDGDGRA